MKQITNSFFLDEPLDKVARVLCSEAFNVAVERLRDEFVSTEYVVLEQSEERLVFELRTVERERSMTGALKRKTFTSSTINTWDAQSRTLRWDYRGQLGDRARFTGIVFLTEEGSVTHLGQEITVDVRIPLIRGALSGAVCRALERGFPDFERLFRVYLKRDRE